MTEPTPEPTPLELVARLAAEAAVRALPDHGGRLLTLEQTVGEIVAALQAAASPEGNAARLAARLDAVEQQLAALAAAEPVMPALQQRQLDDLRLKFANIERTQ